MDKQCINDSWINIRAVYIYLAVASQTFLNLELATW